MAQPHHNSGVADGDLVSAADMPAALTAAALVFEDGATQVFSSDGHTIYDDHARRTGGTWSVLEDGKFSSFWPPSYRATYTLSWIVEGGATVGLTFIEIGRGERFVGRYQ